MTTIKKGLCQCGCGQKTAIWPRGPKKGQPRAYIGRHGYPTTPDYTEDPDTGCWVWSKGLRNGYGRKMISGRLWTAHRWYWEQVHGPVPTGLDLDHLCRNRACVNPAHLEPVTRATNVRRGNQTKLSQADVDAIRAAPAYWGYRVELAARFNISIPAIAKLRAGDYWHDKPER